MQRYFVSTSNWAEEKVILTEDAHHIMRVMRNEVDDYILCVHPSGKVAKCQITHLDEANNEVIARVIEWLEDDAELPLHVTILQSLPKGNKLDFIIQKGTELGASEFVLYQSERSVVKWNKKRIKNRLQRFEKIAKEASEQSGRNFVPKITFYQHIAQYLEEKENKQAIKLLAYEEEARHQPATSLYHQLKKATRHDELILGIGPEGGFSSKEVDEFKAYNFTPIRLGRRILRTETAALYALASISYHFEEME